MIPFAFNFLVLNLSLRLLLFSSTEYLNREFDLRQAHLWREIARAAPPCSYKKINSYLKALEHDPADILAYLELGEVYYELAITYGHRDLYQQAIESFSSALQLQPDLVEAHYRLGTIYFLLYDFEQSRRQLETARRIDPEYAPVQNSLRILGKER